MENVRIFDGTSDRLSAPSNVLLVGNVIKAISKAAIADPPSTSVIRLQGHGRTLMSPYAGKLGVIQEGALADLLVVGGDPLTTISLIADPGKKFVLIMKDGTIYKNLLR